MLSIFNPKLISGVNVPEKQEKESVRSIILKYKKFPLKYTPQGNLTGTKNPELFNFCLEIAKDMTGACNKEKTWYNRLNNVKKDKGEAESPMAHCEAVNLYIKLTDNTAKLSEEDLFSEICNFLKALDLQKENSNQYSSVDNWVEACSLLQKQYNLFDSDLNGDGYCPKISKMAQLFGAKKASGIYLRFIDDICSVATIFACKDLTFYWQLKKDMDEAIESKLQYSKKDRDDMVDEKYCAINMTATSEVSNKVLNIIKELKKYAEVCDSSMEDYNYWSDNPFLLGQGIRRRQLKQLGAYILDMEEDTIETAFISDELLEKISNIILEDITDNTNEHQEIIKRFKNFQKYSNIDEKLLNNIDDEEVSSFIRDALICYKAETYIDKIRRGGGNAESFKDDINQALFEYGLRDLQENDAENYYIDWYVYNALSGYEHLIAKDRSK